MNVSASLNFVKLNLPNANANYQEAVEDCSLATMDPRRRKDYGTLAHNKARPSSLTHVQSQGERQRREL